MFLLEKLEKIKRPVKVERAQKNYLSNEKYQDYAENQFKTIYDYLDKLIGSKIIETKTELWNNPSDEFSSFLPQTLNIDGLENYDAIEIEFCTQDFSGSEKHKVIQRFAKNEYSSAFTIIPGSGKASYWNSTEENECIGYYYYIHCRKFKWKDSQITFEHGYRTRTDYGFFMTVQHEYALVPYKIYGIKNI